MSAEMTQAVTTQWFNALKAGNGAAALDCLDPAVHWINSPEAPGKLGGIPGLSAIVPWLGDFPNKQAVIDSFAIWAKLSQVLDFQLVDILIKDDQALAIIHEKAVIKATGLNYDIEFIQRIRVANNQIVFWKSYWDTAQGIVAFRGDMKARLIAAAKAAKLEEADLVLPFGANPNTVEDASGLSVLMIAAGRGHTDLVQKLLTHGADPNLLDARAGGTALHKACQGGHLESVKALVEAGAHLDVQATGTGHTPVVEAIWFTSDVIVEYLLAKGARIERTTFYGFTIDDHIAYAKKVNAGKAALAALDRIDQLVKKRRAEDATAAQNPLITAVQNGDLNATRRALADATVELEARCPIIGKFDDGHTALLIAARNNQLEIVKLLIAAGANVNAVEPVFGAVPLHKATYHGYAAIASALALAKGIDLNYQGPSNGYTPLHDALWHAHPSCARILLAAGARKNIQAYDGLYPIDIARKQLPGDPIVNELIISGPP